MDQPDFAAYQSFNSDTKEHVLLTLFGPEPKSEIARLKHLYPFIEEVTFVRVDDTDNFVDVQGLASRVGDGEFFLLFSLCGRGFGG